MEVDRKIKLEATERENCLLSRAKVKKEYGECLGCFDLQEKITQANEKCMNLELDIGKKESLIECLEHKVAFTELEKLQLVDEVRKLKQGNVELERIIRDSKIEHEKVNLLMMENKVLDYEKKEAESDLEAWKVKCKELEVQVMELEKRLSAGMTKEDLGLLSAHDVSGTTPTETPSKHWVEADGLEGGQSDHVNKSTVKKCLNFAAEWLFQSFFPTTPGSSPLVEPIHIADCDVRASSPGADCKGHKRSETTTDVMEPVVEHQSNEEGSSSFSAGKPFRMAKRRKLREGAACVVTSESESDDNIPIARLRSRKQSSHFSETKVTKKYVDGSWDNPEKHTPRRRLRRVGDIEQSSALGNQKVSGISENMSINESPLEDEMEESDSSSEGESLGGFIVESSGSDESDFQSGSYCHDMSEQDGSSSEDCSEESGSASEGSLRYDKIISSLRRERKHKLKWEYETDMLADLGKSAELCMKAICVLYRQQTSEEKSFKAALHRNGRGFNQYHASRGTALAEFLTDGNPRGDMTKTVKQLRKFDSKGVELCQELACHYSKQLFEIYKNEEDPFFHP